MTRRSFLTFLASSALPDGRPLERLSGNDQRFLEKVQRAALLYFVEQMDPKNGLVRDRDRDDAPASIAATGFGLVALAIAAERKVISRDEALKRVRTCLHFFSREAEHHGGFFFHFLDFKSGERYQEKWKSEVSSVDTAWLLAGALVAKVSFQDRSIAAMADQIEERINWNWMRQSQETLSMGWTPEGGFLPARWDHYAEHLLMLLLAIGSPTYPIPADCWKGWQRRWTTYKGHRFLWGPPLFIHQYSHAFVDFRNWRDETADFWDSSIQATLANRQFCMDRADRFKSYGPDSWGLTACDGPDGYRAYGAEENWHDGTVAPCGPAGSLPFAPKRCVSALRHFYETYGDRLWGRYGFRDAFNLDRNWFAPDTLGIDQGITVLMIENVLTGKVWRWAQQIPSLKRGIQRAGLIRVKRVHRQFLEIK